MRILRSVLTVSLAVTEGILLLEGRWQEAIPLHLCSISAIAALFTAFGAGAWALDFLWYLGIPGAMLALLFPAPAVSRYQALLNASYVATHALIIVIPLWLLAKGRRVRKGRSCRMLLVMQALALLAFFVNRQLGTDFMFLMAPPAGTPLCIAYAWGYGFYLLTLEGLVALLLLITGGLLPRWFPDLFC